MEVAMYSKINFDIAFSEALYQEDKKIAQRFYKQNCQYDCSGIYYTSNYPRKPRGITPESEHHYNFRFSFCCSNCRLRFTPETVRFLGRKVYVALFIMMILSTNEKLQNELIELPPQSIAPITFKRWIVWWDLIVQKSPAWKKLVGLLSANIENIFLPLFIVDQFIQDTVDFNKSVLSMLEFISPISFPPNYPSESHISWPKDFTQKMKLQKIKNTPYIKRSD